MKLIPNSLTQKIGRQILVAQKNSPRTLFVLGIAGVVGGTILACRATLKLEAVLEEAEEEIKNVKKDSVKEYNKDLAYVYGKNAYKVVKLYAPAVIIGGAAIGALTGSHVTLTRRNASLTAAYSAVSASFEAYRERVRNELGEDKEKDLHHSIRIGDLTVDGKTQAIKVADPNKWSPYARFFDEGSIHWKKTPEYNRLFVQCQQNYANQLLQARGHIFLNEVYDMLGIDRSQAGQVVGWVINQGGDNYIDFGMFEAANAQFINGWERNVILDFNVDGVIMDKI